MKIINQYIFVIKIYLNIYNPKKNVTFFYKDRIKNANEHGVFL